MTDALAVRPTIPARYLAELFAHADVDAARVLALAGVPPRASRVSVAQLERVYAIARDAGDDEWFGVLRAKVPRGSYAHCVRQATRCAALADFFDDANRFYALFDRGHRYWELEQGGGRAILRVRPRTRAQAESIFFVHSTLLTPWRSAIWLAGERIPLAHVGLDPRFAAFDAETRFLFGVAPTFTPDACELAFDAAWLAAPIVRAPADADAYARTSLRSLLAAPAIDSIEARVRAALATARPFASSSLATVARGLRTSRASLARALAARGLAFQAIKDELRRDHAIALLSSGSSVAACAERVGFSEPSAFTRAFKAWTGVAPATFLSSQPSPRGAALAGVPAERKRDGVAPRGSTRAKRDG